MAIAVAAVLIPGVTNGYQGNGIPLVNEYPLPKGSHPLGITTDQSGNIYVACSGTGTILKASRDNLTWFPYLLPTPNGSSEIWGMAADRKGRIWFTDTLSNAIWCLDPSTGNFTSYTIPTRHAYPFQLVLDESGTVWFTELYGGAIGRLAPETGLIREFFPPSPSSGPSGLAIDSSGSIWFSEALARNIGRFSPKTGEFEEYPLPGSSFPRGVIADRQGKIWVADSGGSALYRFDPERNQSIAYVTPFPQYATESEPYFLVMGPTGELWINERMGNKIARLDPVTMSLVEVELRYLSTKDLANWIPPPCCSNPVGMPIVPVEALAVSVDGEGNLWFTESLGDKVGMVRGDISSPVKFQDIPGSLPLQSGKTTRTVFTPKIISGDPSSFRLTYSVPSSADELLIDLSPLARSDPGVSPYQLSIDVPPGLVVHPTSVTVTAVDGSFAASALITLGDTVSSSPTRASSPWGGFLIIALGGALAIHRKVK